VSSSQRPSSAISTCGSTQSCPGVNMSRVGCPGTFFPPAPSTLCSSRTRPRRVCATDLGRCAVTPRLLQRRPRRPPGGDTGTTQSPARGGETRARPETTRPCNSGPSGVALASCRATNRVQTVFPRAQGPDWSGAEPHHQPAHVGHQHSVTLFTACLQQRRPLPTKN